MYIIFNNIQGITGSILRIMYGVLKKKGNFQQKNKSVFLPQKRGHFQEWKSLKKEVILRTEMADCTTYLY